MVSLYHYILFDRLKWLIKDFFPNPIKYSWPSVKFIMFLFKSYNLDVVSFFSSTFHLKYDINFQSQLIITRTNDHLQVYIHFQVLSISGI